jgi:transcriptional regulator with XRE-family HTH domain
MKITGQLNDQAILMELGGRLAGVRLGRNLTQAALAEQAGVSKRTVERLEAGAVATQLSGFVRVCRVLGLLEGFENLVPEAAPGPMEQLKRKGRMRQRASGKRLAPAKPLRWTWGDGS